MRRSKKLKKIPILLVLLIITVTAFTVPRALSITASAPFFSLNDGASVIVDTSEPPVLSAFPVDLLVSEPSAVKPSAHNNGYISVRMDVSGVSAGSLILINHSHRYDIPDETDFVSVSEMKTASYRAATDKILVSGSVIGPLNEMMDAFRDETGVSSVTVISAFRDYEKQQETLDEYIALMGSAEASRWAAVPGYSEHQTGLAIDLGVFSGGALRTFLGTGVNAWFLQNSYKYGFVLRFPENKTDITGTAHEPWHFRYVGIPHAYIMYQNDLCLEEYIDMLADYSYDEPYRITYDGEKYAIYSTRDSDVPIPFDCEFDISGNNTDGFIITLKF